MPAPGGRVRHAAEEDQRRGCRLVEPRRAVRRSAADSSQPGPADSRGGVGIDLPAFHAGRRHVACRPGWLGRGAGLCPLGGQQPRRQHAGGLKALDGGDCRSACARSLRRDVVVPPTLFGEHTAACALLREHGAPARSARFGWASLSGRRAGFPTIRTEDVGARCGERAVMSVRATRHERAGPWPGFGCGSRPIARACRGASASVR